MTETIELLTATEMAKRLGFSRDHFYRNYRYKVSPILTSEGRVKYSLTDVLKRKAEYETEKKNRGRKLKNA